MTITRTLALLSLSLATVPLAAALAADPPSTAAAPAVAKPATPATGSFLTTVAGSNLFEIESSKLALAKSGNEKVKGFANQMIADHTQAGTKFKQAVAEAKLTPPAEKLDTRHQAILDDLTKRDGAGFDQAYVKAQHDAHVEAVGLFDAYARSGDNARLKQFAAETLPTLKQHLQHVTSMQ